MPTPGAVPGAQGADRAEVSAAVARPVSHQGLSSALPPLQPCTDARTPAESLRLPRAQDPASSAAQQALVTSAGAAVPSGGTDATSGAGDVLLRLQALQREVERSEGPQRHWGPAERGARDALESCSSSAEAGCDAREAAEAVELAVQASDFRAIDPDGFALLHHAAMHGSLEGVACLLRQRANLNSRTKVHETPLMVAAYYRHPEVVALLLAHRARADLADWQGRTPLAAAKASRCGNGRDNHARSQAWCVEILAEQEQRRRVAGLPREVEELRKQGGDFFRKGQLKEAAAAYSIALSFEDEAGLYANRAACYLQLGKFLEAKLDAQKAVGFSGEAGHKKASWRLAKAALALGELDRADEALKDALEKFDGDVALRQLKNEVALERRHRLGAA